jgi:uncharacterized protein (DUF305 family)
MIACRGAIKMANRNAHRPTRIHELAKNIIATQTKITQMQNWLKGGMANKHTMKYEVKVCTASCANIINAKIEKLGG